MTTNKQDDSFPFEFTDGLTKRELFAAVALQGLLANPNSDIPEIEALQAVKAADVLIAALDDSKKKMRHKLYIHWLPPGQQVIAACGRVFHQRNCSYLITTCPQCQQKQQQYYQRIYSQLTPKNQ